MFLLAAVVLSSPTLQCASKCIESLVLWRNASETLWFGAFPIGETLVNLSLKFSWTNIIFAGGKILVKSYIRCLEHGQSCAWCSWVKWQDAVFALSRPDRDLFGGNSTESGSGFPD
jgi:hypothetical protein